MRCPSTPSRACILPVRAGVHDNKLLTASFLPTDTDRSSARRPTCGRPRRVSHSGLPDAMPTAARWRPLARERSQVTAVGHAGYAESPRRASFAVSFPPGGPQVSGSIHQHPMAAV